MGELKKEQRLMATAVGLLLLAAFWMAVTALGNSYVDKDIAAQWCLSQPRVTEAWMRDSSGRTWDELCVEMYKEAR